MKEEEEKSLLKMGQSTKWLLRWNGNSIMITTLLWLRRLLVFLSYRRRRRWRWGGERERLSRTATRRHDNWCSGVSGTDGLQRKMELLTRWCCYVICYYSLCTNAPTMTVCTEQIPFSINWHNFFVQAHLLFPIV